MNWLICAATPFEILPLEQHLRAYFALRDGVYARGDHKIRLLITGVGLPVAAAQIAIHLTSHCYDIALQAGIAGALDAQLQAGDVVQVPQDRFADVGVEQQDGSFTSVEELDLNDGDRPPFQQGGWLINPTPPQDFLPPATGISVNWAHGSRHRIEALRQRYPEAQLESMEGAAFAYVCLLRQQPFLQIRSISNYVEPRNAEAWEIGRAITQLNEVLLGMIAV